MWIHSFGVDIARRVIKGFDDGNFYGRAADGGISLPALSTMIMAAGHGDHVDIGSLFGASSIAAALTKKEAGWGGTVYCIDPYTDRRQQGVAFFPGRDPRLLDGAPEHLEANVKAAGLEWGKDVVLIHKLSHPWPDELKDEKFVSAYIDGNHLAPFPWQDWLNVSERTQNLIAFDNVEEEYPDVIAAFVKAQQNPEWIVFYKSEIFGVLRRRLPPRSRGTDLRSM